jgi:hypothetical protein
MLMAVGCRSTFGADSLESDLSPMFNEYCVRCHGPEKSEGKLRVDQLTADFADHDNAAAWIEIRNAINLGEMPPDGQKRLPVELIEKTSRWIAAQLRASERARVSSGGRVLLRRMNRHEYTNTVAELLSMKFPTGESPLDVLPPDGTADGFDKVKSALAVLTERTARFRGFGLARVILTMRCGSSLWAMRGGAWTCAPAAVRSSIRTFAEAADAAVYTGFRVVRETS